MIFVSVGHHKDRPGASFDGFNEYDEAQLWAAELKHHLKDECLLVPVGILKDKVNFINNRDPSRSIAMEIHFNSAKDLEGRPIGKGCETLYYPYSKKGKRLAETVHGSIAPYFAPDRGVKPGYYRMDPSRGANYFLARTKCPAIIIEPDFIHRKRQIIKFRGEACKDIASALIKAHK